MVILTNPSALFSFRGGQTPIHCLYLNTDDEKELIHIGTNDGFVNVWNLKVSRVFKKMKVSDEPCLSIVRNEQYYITQAKGNSIKFWTCEKDEWTFAKQISLEYVGFCKIVCHGDLLFYPLPDGKFSIRNIKLEEEKTIYYKYNKKQGEIMALLYLPKHDMILALYEAGILTLWKPDGTLVSELELEDTPMTVAFCNLTNEGVIGTNSDVLTKFSLNDCKLVVKKQTTLTNPGVSSLAIHDSGKVCVVGCWDGSLKYIKMNSLRLLAVITHRNEPIQAVIFSEKSLTQWGSGIVFIAGPDQKVSLCNLYCKQLSRPFSADVELQKKK